MILELTVAGMPALRKRFEALPQKIRQQAAVRGLTRAAEALRTHIKLRKLSGEPLHARTGQLRGSVSYRVETRTDGVLARIGPHVPYARIQEFGGTIRPRRGQFLTIPLRAAMTAAGATRFTARAIISSPSIGGFEGTFFRDHILFGKRGKQAVPLFVLKRSVTIPARSYLRSSLRESRQAIINTVLGEIRKAVAA